MAAVGIVGLGLSSIGFIKQVREILRDLKRRLKNFQEIQDLCNELDAQSQTFEERLECLLPSRASAPSNISEVNQYNLDRIANHFEEQKDKLVSLREDVSNVWSSRASRIRCFWRANRWAKKLEDLREDLQTLEKDLLVLGVFEAVTRGVADGFASTKEMMEEPLAKLTEEIGPCLSRVERKVSEKSSVERRFQAWARNVEEGFWGWTRNVEQGFWWWTRNVEQGFWGWTGSVEQGFWRWTRNVRQGCCRE